MLHWDPQGIRSGGDLEQSRTTDLDTYMFPYSAYVPSPTPDSRSQAPQNDHQNSRSQSHHLQYDAMMATTDFPPCAMPPLLSSHPMHTSQSYQALTPQQEYFNGSQSTYTVSNSPPSLPASPTQAPPSSINEPQIRLNANMFKPDYGRYVAVSLDPRHVAR